MALHQQYGIDKEFLMEQRLRTIIRITDGGRIVIPAEVRERLGMEIGTRVILNVEDDHATLMTAKTARRKARERVLSRI
jgi:AbrB family looped-hinge helix DNA binding protein